LSFDPRIQPKFKALYLFQIDMSVRRLIVFSNSSVLYRGTQKILLSLLLPAILKKLDITNTLIRKDYEKSFFASIFQPALKTNSETSF